MVPANSQQEVDKSMREWVSVLGGDENDRHGHDDQQEREESEEMHPGDSCPRSCSRTLPVNMYFPGIKFTSRTAGGMLVHLPRAVRKPKRKKKRRCRQAQRDEDEEEDPKDGKSKSRLQVVRIRLAKKRRSGSRIKSRNKARPKHSLSTDTRPKIEEPDIQMLQQTIRDVPEERTPEPEPFWRGRSESRSRKVEFVQSLPKTTNATTITATTTSKVVGNADNGNNGKTSSVVCCKCPYSVTLDANGILTLTKHLLDVHHQRLFICPGCPGSGMYYYLPGTLRRHLASKHDDDAELHRDVDAQESTICKFNELVSIVYSKYPMSFNFRLRTATLPNATAVLRRPTEELP